MAPLRACMPWEMFAPSNAGPVAEAVFSGDLKGGESPSYAYYPYSEENASADQSAIRGNLKLEQAYDMASGKLEGDYKVGTMSFASVDGRSYSFKATTWNASS